MHNENSRLAGSLKTRCAALSYNNGAFYPVCGIHDVVSGGIDGAAGPSR